MKNCVYNDIKSTDTDKTNLGSVIVISLFAAMLPYVWQIALYPNIFRLISEGFSLTVSQSEGMSSIISFLFTLVQILILSGAGGFLTRSRAGILRFCGYFMFASTISNGLFAFSDIIKSLITDVETAAYIVLACDYLSALLTAFIIIRFFLLFEKRGEERFIAPAMMSSVKKRLIILIVIVIAASTVMNVINAVLTMVSTSEINFVYVRLTAGVIGEYLSFIAIMTAVFLLSKGIRGNKRDFIGVGAAYYLPGLFTAPVIQLVTGIVNSSVDKEGNSTQLMISGITASAVSVLSAIASLIIAFMVLKVFFPVREEHRKGSKKTQNNQGRGSKK